MNQDKIKKYLDERKIVTDKGCWVLSTSRTNYPVIMVDRKRYQLSRIVKQIYQGITLVGLALHKCDNPRCWNPEHIFDGTHTDNILDSLEKNRAIPIGQRINRFKTHCPQGHEHNEQNTYYYKRNDGRINKVCKICSKEHLKNRRKFQRGP